ncbi:MAG: hypothetical protein L0I03_07595, partial [Lactococcus lactis]|nr:hypothetical protein [Lactococcus lactis]
KYYNIILAFNVFKRSNPATGNLATCSGLNFSGTLFYSRPCMIQAKALEIRQSYHVHYEISFRYDHIRA